MQLYQVDAFSDKIFGGNPAAVVPLDAFRDDAWLLNIAIENNLSETAYLVPRPHGYDLRWFTPGGEVDLCGHATLASAHVLYAHLAYHLPSITFHTRSGILTVERVAPGRYRMQFPADIAYEVKAPLVLTELGLAPEAVLRGKDDFLVVLKNEATVRGFVPDSRLILQLDARGLIITAPGSEVDFVSRCFFPAYGIPEDPVPGSAHTVSAPYWATRLDRSTLEARQLSARGGTLYCEVTPGQVALTGDARTYLIGHLTGA